jgi:hypothetical protein
MALVKIENVNLISLALEINMRIRFSTDNNNSIPKGHFQFEQLIFSFFFDTSAGSKKLIEIQRSSSEAKKVKDLNFFLFANHFYNYL